MQTFSLASNMSDRVKAGRVKNMKAMIKTCVRFNGPGAKSPDNAVPGLARE